MAQTKHLLPRVEKYFKTNIHSHTNISDGTPSPEEMKKIRQWLDQNGKPEKVELLPYHAMGENKYRALGQEPQRFQPPDAEKLKQLQAIFDCI